MVSRYRHRRTSNPATAFPGQIEPGEIAVNTANRQLATGDASGGTLGVPLALIAVRMFDARAQYAIGDFMVRNGELYRAKVAVPPGAFNAASWDQYSPPTAVNASGVVFTPAGSVGSANVQAAIAELDSEKVAKAGDTMTGQLTLPAGATATDAVRRDYVDAADALKAPLASPVFTGDPKAPTPNPGDNDTSVATTAFVTSALAANMSGLAPLASPVFTGDPKAPTPNPGDNDTSIATTAFVTTADAGGVRWDTPQSMAASARQQARQNIAAAPFDAMAFNGVQVNGNMEINQTTSAIWVSPQNGQFIDSWYVVASGVTVGAINNLIGGGGSTQPPPGYLACINIAITTPKTTLAAADYATAFNSIEGYRVARLMWGTANAQPLSIGFWVNAVRPGTYSGSIRNGDANRSYPFTFAVAASNTWEFKTVTIPGDTTGTWYKTSQIGLSIFFSIALGTSLTAPANAWAAGNFYGANGTINGAQATSDVFSITGLIMLPGLEMPPVERAPFIMRPFDQELIICRRYWQRFPGFIFDGYNGAGASIYATVPLVPNMRVPPTVTLPIDSFSNVSGIGAVGFTTSGVQVYTSINAAGAGYIIISPTFDARL